MTSLDDALADVRRYQHEDWKAAAASGFATPETDAQLLDIWDVRELLSSVASRLAGLQDARTHDPNLGAAIASITHAHGHVYRVEVARHLELGSVASGERGRDHRTRGRAR